MGNELNFDNIISGDEIADLFSLDEDTTATETETQEDSTKESKEDKETTEVSTDTLFSDKPESVSSDEKDDHGREDTTSKDSGDTSQSSFYSSIATALRDEGILPDLDDNSLKNIKSPEDFAKAMETQIQTKLDEKQKRVDEALGVGVEPDEIKKYENTLSYLDTLTDDLVEDESEQGEQLRRNLIYQDYINRGFSETRAKKEMEKSFSAGTDVEDALESIQSNKEFFNSQYKELIKAAKKQEEERESLIKQQAEELKTSIFSKDPVFDKITLSEAQKQKVYDSLTKPIHKDKSGQYLTAIQKAEKENRTDFLKKVGIVFTLTNGFKDLDNLVGSVVKKETRKSLRELEHVLSNTSRNADGNLSFFSGASGDVDPESKIGLNLDI